LIATTRKRRKWRSFPFFIKNHIAPKWWDGLVEWRCIKFILEGVRGLFRGEWLIFAIVTPHGPTALTERKSVLRSNSSGSRLKLLPPLFVGTYSVGSVRVTFQPVPPSVGPWSEGNDKLRLFQIIPRIIQITQAR
jgi:hypothetical protein